MTVLLCIFLYFLIGKVFGEILWNIHDSTNAYKTYCYFFFPEYYGDLTDIECFGERISKNNGPAASICDFSSDEIIFYKFTRGLFWPIYIIQTIISHIFIGSPFLFFKYRNSIKQKKAVEGQDKLTQLYSEKVRIETNIEELEKELGISEVAVGVYRKK